MDIQNDDTSGLKLQLLILVYIVSTWKHALCSSSKLLTIHALCSSSKLLTIPALCSSIKLLTIHDPWITLLYILDDVPYFQKKWFGPYVAWKQGKLQSNKALHNNDCMYKLYLIAVLFWPAYQSPILMLTFTSSLFYLV